MAMAQLKDDETRLETAAAGEETDGRQPDWQARYLGRVEYEISGLREDFRRMDGRLEGLGVALSNLREQVRDDISSLRVDVRALRTDTDRLKEDIEGVKRELQEDMEGVKRELREDMKELRGIHRWVIASIITSIVGISTTLVAVFSKLL